MHTITSRGRINKMIYSRKMLRLLSGLCLLFSVAVLTGGGFRDVDLLQVEGRILNAEAGGVDESRIEAHPRASSGYVICLEPGTEVTLSPEIEGHGRLFLQAMSLSSATTLTLTRCGDDRRFTFDLRPVHEWTPGKEMSLKKTDRLIFSTAADAAVVLIDRLFFTPDDNAVVFGNALRNDLTAWDPAMIRSYVEDHGNLVPNGGFHVPLGGDWSLAWFSPFFLPESARRIGQEGDPERFLRIPLDRYSSRHNDITLASGMFGTESNTEYTFKVTLRGKGRVVVALPADLPSIRFALNNDGRKTDMFDPVRVELSSEWQTITVPFIGGGNGIVQISGGQGATGGGSFMDIAQVAVYRSSHADAPSPPIEAGLVLPDPARVFSEGASLNSTLVCRFGQTVDAGIRFRVFDVFGNFIAEKTFPVAGAKGQTVEYPASLDWIDDQPGGAYRVELWHENTFLKEHLFSVLPEPLPLDQSTGFFGVYSAGSEEIVSVLKRLGVTAVGTQNLASDLSRLQTIFPSPDAEVVSNLRYTTLFHDAGMEVVPTLLGRPRWIDDPPTKEQLDAFATRIRAWIDAHEGHIGTILGWMELRQIDATDLFDAMSRAVRSGLSAAEKPPAFFHGLGVPEQAEKVLRASGTDGLNGLAAQIRYATDQDLASFATLRLDHDLRLWDMEMRVWRQSAYRQRLSHNSFRKTDTTLFSPAWACAKVVKSAVRSRVLAGMERFMYYYMGPASTWFGWMHYHSLTLTEYDGAIHPVGVSLAYLTSRLDGATEAKRLSAPEGIQMYGFVNPNGSTVVLWSDLTVAAMLRFDHDAHFTVRDISGRPIPAPSIPVSRIPLIVTSSERNVGNLAATCLAALSDPKAGRPRYAVENEAITVGINALKPLSGRPLDAETAWMESAWNSPLNREWRAYADGRIPLDALAAPGVSMPYAEIRGAENQLWQFPLTVLVAHPERYRHSGGFDKIMLNAGRDEAFMTRGRTSGFFDLGVLVRARYTPDELTLLFDITDNRIRPVHDDAGRGDVLKLFVGTSDPIIVNPPERLESDGNTGWEQRVELADGVSVLISLSRWGWRAMISLSPSACGTSDFSPNLNIPFAFEYRDADDSAIQQRTLGWGLREHQAGPGSGTIVLSADDTEVVPPVEKQTFFRRFLEGWAPSRPFARIHD